MGLTTLTQREQQWRDRAQRALERDEPWEACDECLRYHPAAFDGACDDRDNTLPSRPAELRM